MDMYDSFLNNTFESVRRYVRERQGAIIHDANNILDGLNKADFESESINWGDLSCAEADLCFDSGTPYWRVVIEEADSYSLREYVAQKLREKGWGSKVLVVTEW